MKTQNTTQATAKDWIICEPYTDRRGVYPVGIKIDAIATSIFGEFNRLELAEKCVQAVNQFDALNAIVEAAKVDGIVRGLTPAMDKALSTLATLQGK